MKKIPENWNRVVKPEDTVVVAGDISWAMSHTGAVADLRFLDSLNGKKIIGRGNHDYWWTSMKKLGELCADEGFTTLRFLYQQCVRGRDLHSRRVARMVYRRVEPPYAGECRLSEDRRERGDTP